MVLAVQLFSLLLTTTAVVQAFSASTSTSSSSNSADAAVKVAMEETVRTYFQGVREKDAAKIRSCFGECGATIWDVCGMDTNNNNPEQGRTVLPADQLVERCMDFVAAHPDGLQIDLLYGPECGRNSDWVVVHWYETGLWSGGSCGVPAPVPPQPFAVQGQTRFRVHPETLKIQEFVVTRTFTEWETQVRAMRSRTSS